MLPKRRDKILVAISNFILRWTSIEYRIALSEIMLEGIKHIYGSTAAELYKSLHIGGIDWSDESEADIKDSKQIS